MKIKLVILALLVAFISCFPCQDKTFAADFQTSLTIQSHEDSHPEALHGDFCSPFCICACCASVSIPPVVLTVPSAAKAIFSEENTFHYNNSFGRASLNAIWQPPRLV